MAEQGLDDIDSKAGRSRLVNRRLKNLTQQACYGKITPYSIGVL
jgi:hypothetical protein